MALHVHVRSHPQQLVSELCDLLAVPPQTPFTQDLVAVPTRGIERWLTQQIATGLGERIPGGGICANLAMPSPAGLLDEVITSLPDFVASRQAWEGAQLLSSVMGILDTYQHEPWLRVVARYIESGATNRLGNTQRYRASLRIARLFATYARYRPEMVRRWHQGLDVGADLRCVTTDQAWQPRLWRLLREAIALPSPPELLPEVLQPIRDGSVRLEVPERIGVYGLTAIDPLELEVWDALAARRDVHLYVLNPSPALWNQIGARGPRVREGLSTVLRSSDSTSSLAHHPLLKSWAQESRELQMALGDRGAPLSRPPSDHVEPSHLLAQLQSDVRHNRAPTRTKYSDDRSVQIHVCHGDRRQVEVVRDAILHILAADPSLEPRDVVIMTPDLSGFAPLLEASFFVPSSDDELEDEPSQGRTGIGLPDLRVRLADRAPSATNPLVRFAATVLDLVASRLEAGTVRELIALSVVRRYFNIDDETADALAAVIDDAAVSWGINADQRTEWGAGAHEDRTWRRGLDRALAGVFYSDDPVRLVGTLTPLSGVEGTDAETIGLLAQIIDRIEEVRKLLRPERSFAEWGPAIAAAVRLLAAPGWDEQWQWGQLERLLAQSFPTPAVGETSPTIGAAEARLAIRPWTNDTPSPLHFRTGDVTVCTLAPMRSIPYRVVCLLGMDDHRFPRAPRTDGDDLLVGDERVGDPERGAEDRQMLLDALLAAGDYLVVTYSGRDHLTNAVYPAAVPIVELEDLVTDMVGEKRMSSVVTPHPLQPFSEDNFVPGTLGLAGPWGFDRLQQQGAEAMRTPHPGGLPRIVLPPPDDGQPELRLEDLIAFLDHPARYFLRSRLGFRIPERGEIKDDTVPTRLDPLAEWGVTNRMLNGMLAGHRLDDLARSERGKDAVPPANLGDHGLGSAYGRARNLWSAIEEIDYDPSRHLQVTGSVRVGGRLLEGSVTADPVRSRITVVTPSRLKGKHRLQAYTRLVFLSVVAPSQPWTAILVGRSPKDNTEWSVRVGPLGDDTRQRLEDLVSLHDEGFSRPLPLPVETSYVWRRKLGSGEDRALREAKGEWEGRFPEWGDPSYRLLFPDLERIESLVSTEFPSLAHRLWSPILPTLREKAV